MATTLSNMLLHALPREEYFASWGHLTRQFCLTPGFLFGMNYFLYLPIFLHAVTPLWRLTLAYLPVKLWAQHNIP